MPDEGVGVRVPPPTLTQATLKQLADAVLQGAHPLGSVSVGDGSSMKFHSLKITNLRAIRQFEINDLGSFVVVAG